MTWRGKAKWLLVATLLLCTPAAWFMWPSGHAITAATYEQLRVGMTRDEVEDLLCGPGRTREDFVR